MSRRLKKHALLLKFLGKCDRHSANSIIKNAKPDLLKCFSEICYNILKGGVRLDSKQKQKLQKYKQHIRKLANKKTTAKTKREIIQKGGIIGTLIKTLGKVILGSL